jgi:hypothetical protein
LRLYLGMANRIAALAGALVVFWGTAQARAGGG